MNPPKLSLAFARALEKDYRGCLSGLIAQYGNAFMLKGFSNNMHIFSDPKFIGHIMFTNGENYTRLPNFTDSIFEPTSVQERETWSKERSNVFNPLLSENNVKKHLAGLVATTTKHLKTWEEYEKKKTPLLIHQAISLIYFENLCNYLLGGIKFSEPERIMKNSNDTIDLMTKYTMSITKLPWILPTKIRQRSREVLKEIAITADTILEHCMNKPVPEDNIVKSLVNNYITTHGHLDAAGKIYLRNRVSLLFIPGFDSVSGTLTQAFTNLSLYPLVMKAVSDEVKKVVGTRDLVADDIDQLPYIRAVILESLRLSKELPFLPRLALADDEIDNYKIKKGDRILIPIFYIHRLPNYWENPEGFDPTRFLKPLDEHYRYIYMPFGAGTRGCIGKNIAIVEGITIIAMIMQRYRLFLEPNQTINDNVDLTKMMVYKES